MPVDFCRRVVGKNSEKCLSLSERLLTDFLYLNNATYLRHSTQRIVLYYTHKMAIASGP